MNKTRKNRALLFVVCMVLVAATALFATGCSDSANKEGTAPVTAVMEDGAVLGEGAKQFSFTVVDGAGNETTVTINSDKKTVGEALFDENLIAGEEGPYGLYVMEVNGIRAVYEEDSTYWAFYINGEYGMSGVDATDIETGASYAFKVEK